MKINTALTENVKNLGVAVSGGVDSMVLLHALAAAKPSGQTIKVINIDHNIRPVTSERDSLTVQKTAEKYGYEFIFKKLDGDYLSEKGGSTENKARQKRYGFFNTLLEGGEVDAIATAHHADDNAESVLLHILRGSGINGASGISPQNGSFVRPLLQIPKQEIHAYAEEHNILFVEDESNLESDYARNFLRNEIFPLLEQKFNGAISKINAFSAHCRREEAFIQSFVPEPMLLPERIQSITENQTAVMRQDERALILKEHFTLPYSLFSRLVFKAFSMLGCRTDIEEKHIDAIIKLTVNTSTGKRADLKNGFSAVKDYGGIVIYKNRYDKENGSPDIEKTANELLNSLPRGELNFDADNLPSGAIWRFREQGDVFTAFNGMTKQLKKYFIDKKIPSRVRDFIPILALDNTVYLIAGLEISDALKVTKNQGQRIIFDYEFYFEKLSELL